MAAFGTPTDPSAFHPSPLIFGAMIHVARPRKQIRHDGASDLRRRRHRVHRVVAAGAVALVIVGGGANEGGAPAIAGAVTNIGLDHHHLWGLAAIPSCTVWDLIDGSAEQGFAIEAFVFDRATAGPSAIYYRRCGPAYQYTYVDGRNGRVSCLTAPVPLEVESCQSTDFLDIILDRCR